MRYLLDENKKPYPVSIEEGVKLFENPAMKIVKSEYLDNENVRVSTVFLGYNAAYYGAEDKPLFFETMVFGGAYDDYMMRYEKYQEAVDGHNEIVNEIKSKLNASL
jgi:hypothetical protein